MKKTLMIIIFISYILTIFALLYSNIIYENEQFWENVGPKWEQMLKQ